MKQLENIEKISIKELEAIVVQGQKELVKRRENKIKENTNKKHEKIINKFGKDNFNELKSLYRKISLKRVEKTINININVEASIDYFIDSNFRIGVDIVDLVEKDDVEDLVIINEKANNLFVQEMHKLLKYKEICTSKKINRQDLISIIRTISKEEDEIIRSIIE